MADYFDGGDTAMGTNGGAVQPATNETAMDEVLVSLPTSHLRKMVSD